MDSRGGDNSRAPPRVKVIETSYVTVTDISRFKSIVQGLTGAAAKGGEDKAVARKRAAFEGDVGGAGTSGAVEDKRQRCGGGASESLVKGDSVFKEELERMLVPDSPSLEDQLKWLFNDDDR